MATLTGYSTSRFLFTLARGSIAEEDWTIFRDVPVFADVKTDDIQIIHEGPMFNYRPLARMEGYAGAIDIAKKLGNGVDRIELADNELQRIGVMYEFDEDADDSGKNDFEKLVSQGYFKLGFDIPQDQRQGDYRIPLVVDIFITKITGENEIPVTFVDFKEPFNVELNKKTAGFDLVDYFTVEEVKESTVERSHMLIDRDNIKSLFVDEKVEVKAEVGTEKPSNELKKVEVESPIVEPEPREIDPEGLYNDIIAPAADTAYENLLSGEVDDSGIEPDDDVDSDIDDLFDSINKDEESLETDQEEQEIVSDDKGLLVFNDNTAPSAPTPPDTSELNRPTVEEEEENLGHRVIPKIEHERKPSLAQASESAAREYLDI